MNVRTDRQKDRRAAQTSRLCRACSGLPQLLLNIGIGIEYYNSQYIGYRNIG